MPSTLPPQGLAKAVPLSDMLFLQIPALFTVFPPLALCSSTTFSVRPLCPYFQFNNIPSGISLPLLFYFLCNYHHVTYYLLHLLILFFICSSSFMHWRRTWQPTPVFLPGKPHGQRSLVGYSLCSHKRVRHDLATKQQKIQNGVCQRAVVALSIPTGFCKMALI